MSHVTRRTVGETIRALLPYFPGTYELNLAVECARRWGWGRNWAGSAEALLTAFNDHPDTVRQYLKDAGVPTKEAT